MIRIFFYQYYRLNKEYYKIIISLIYNERIILIFLIEF